MSGGPCSTFSDSISQIKISKLSVITPKMLRVLSFFAGTDPQRITKTVSHLTLWKFDSEDKEVVTGIQRG